MKPETQIPASRFIESLEHEYFCGSKESNRNDEHRCSCMILDLINWVLTNNAKEDLTVEKSLSVKQAYLKSSTELD